MQCNILVEFERCSEPVMAPRLQRRPRVLHRKSQANLLCLDPPPPSPAPPPFQLPTSAPQSAVHSPQSRQNKEESVSVPGHPIPLLATNMSENRITCHTLHRLLHGQYSDAVQRFVLLDTRYTYEFEGGSVKGARHMQDPDEAEALMQDFLRDDVVVVVFCEFSQKQGPRLYRSCLPKSAWCPPYRRAAVVMARWHEAQCAPRCVARGHVTQGCTARRCIPWGCVMQQRTTLCPSA